MSRSPSAHLSFPRLLFRVEDIDTEVGTRARPSEQAGSPRWGVNCPIVLCYYVGTLDLVTVGKNSTHEEHQEATFYSATKIDENFSSTGR